MLEREINPPSFYEKEEQPEMCLCTYCDKNFILSEMIVHKFQVGTFKYREYRCVECNDEILKNAK